VSETTHWAFQRGNFSLKNLTPGEYKVYAWEDLETGAYMEIRTWSSQWRARARRSRYRKEARRAWS